MSVIPKNQVPVEKKGLHVPSLSEVVEVLQTGLPAYFSDVQVKIADCPDLTQQPFTLASAGLGGSPRLLDVGGPPYLLPLVQRDKLYDMLHFQDLAEMPGKAFIIGAGAGPWPHFKTNCEMVANLLVESNTITRNLTWTGRVNPGDEACIAAQVPGDETRNALLGNFYCSEGLPGKVLEIECKKRIGSDDFIASIRKTLNAKFGEQAVGLGGVFIMKAGKAKQHVMRDFSSTPINTDEEVNNWLKFYDMSAPLIAVGTLVSTDPGLDLRVQHFHSFSHHGEAGHYHIDTQPENAHYVAYLGIAEHIYRLDKPVVTHQVGRD